MIKNYNYTITIHPTVATETVEQESASCDGFLGMSMTCRDPGITCQHLAELPADSGLVRVTVIGYLHFRKHQSVSITRTPSLHIDLISYT